MLLSHIYIETKLHLDCIQVASRLHLSWVYISSRLDLSCIMIASTLLTNSEVLVRKTILRRIHSCHLLSHNRSLVQIMMQFLVLPLVYNIIYGSPRMPSGQCFAQVRFCLSTSKLLIALTRLTRQLDYPKSRVGSVEVLHMPQWQGGGISWAYFRHISRI